MDELKHYVGQSCYFLNLFTEVVKTDQRPFKELLKLDHPAFQQVKREFEHRLQSLYSHPRLGHFIDSGEIDFVLLCCLEQLAKDHNVSYMCSTAYAREEWVPSDLFQALCDCNIVWKSKYFDNFHIEHRVYFDVVRAWCQQRRAQMSIMEKARFQWFRWFSKEARFFGLRYGTPEVTHDNLHPHKATKVDYGWELRRIYYDPPADE